MSGGPDIRVRVVEVEPVADAIKRFRFEPVDGGKMPLFAGGAHTVVKMQDGERVRRNPYSLMGSPFDDSSWQISVLRTVDSRGGSRFMHERVRVGSELVLGHPVNLFPIDWRARKHLLVAGGVGITPFLAMAEQLDREDARFELHYGIRSDAHGAYWKPLAERYGHRVHLYRDDRGQRPDLGQLLQHQPLGTHLYVCGPAPMLEWVLATARRMGWPERSLHSERFLAPPPGVPFKARLARSGITVTVAEDQSFLEALEAAGTDPPYLCRGGACGQCETDVCSYDGQLLHNDHWLGPEDKASGKKIMPCVSRFVGAEIVIDR